VNILVVDDEPAMRRLEARWIEGAGHRCRQAASAAEALELLEAEPADLVVLDIGLPDMDGYEVVRVLKEDKKFSSGLIALTGYAQPEDKERAYKVGFHVHCTKPVGLKELEAAFQKLPSASAR